MVEVINEVEKNNVEQIAINNGSNFKKAEKKLMKSSRYHLFWPHVQHTT